MAKQRATEGPRRGVGAVRRVGKRWPQDLMLAVVRAVVDGGANAHAVAPRFGVPHTTVVEWVRRYRADGEAGLKPGGSRRVRPPRGGSEPARRAAIVAAKRAQPSAGSRRIRDVLKRYFGLGTSATTVRRVLKQEGLAAPRPKARAKTQLREHRFERAEPNQLWQSDLFTFLLRKHERLYVAAFLDDHSRYLVSLSLAHHQRSTLVLEALSRGIAEYGAPREILTDQGRQYTSWRGATEFEAELKRHGIRHIKSRPHHPQTCGKIERFWKTLWEELLARTVFADFQDCERRVALFIQHYNFQRPHQALDGLVPADRYFRAAARIKALTLTAIERERKAQLQHLTITVPGVLRGMDAMQFPAAGWARYALIAADGAVPYRTSLTVGPRYDAELVARALESDLERNDAPLVYRLDRASAHDAPPARAVLAAHRVLLLHGPPRYPCYYGQLERQNREHRAWLRAEPRPHGAALEACLREMLDSVNRLWRRRTLVWQTAAEAWSARPPLTVDRHALREEVQERAHAIARRLSGRGQPADLAERLAIEQTLTRMSYMRQEIGGWC